MRVYTLTDTGLKRSNNQDAYLVDEEHRLYIVCDGMGGHAGGEVASQMAVQNIRDYIIKGLDGRQGSGEFKPDPDNDELSQKIAQAIFFANLDIIERSRTDVTCKQMGTTLVMAALRDQDLYLAHVGDSRIYKIDAKGITRLTKDHSRVQELVDSNTITEEEAERSPFKNIITRALGGGEEVEPDVTIVPYDPYASYLLCTDGLHGVVTEGRIRQVVVNHARDLRKVPEVLLEDVKEGGAPDNVTFVLLEGEKFAANVSEQMPLGIQKTESKPSRAHSKPNIAIPKNAEDHVRQMLFPGMEYDDTEERASLSHIIYGLLVILVVSLLGIFSFSNYRTFYLDLDIADREATIHQGTFFPVGRTELETLSINEGSGIELEEYISGSQFRRVLDNGTGRFESKDDAVRFLGDLAYEIGRNLRDSQNNSERNLEFSIRYLQRAGELNPALPVRDEIALAQYELGKALQEREQYVKALDYLQQAADSRALDESIPINRMLLETRTALIEKLHGEFKDLLAEKNWVQANSVIDRALKHGLSMQLRDDWRKELDEARKLATSEGPPVPTP